MNESPFPPTAPSLRWADYTLTSEQEQLRSTFKTFFEREVPLERVRAAESTGFDAALWAALVDVRVVAMGVPEDLGGDGANLIDLSIVAEQFGHFLAPVPLLEAVVATRALARCSGSPARDWVDGAATGKLIPTIALQATDEPQLVPSAAVADAVLALVDGQLILSTTSSRLDRVENQAGSPLAWWDPHANASSVVLATGPDAAQIFETARREWKLLMAAAFVGIAEATLAIGVEYAKSREASGRPIGAYQAVAHPLADVWMGASTARRLIGKACWFAEFAADEERHLTPLAHYYAEQTATSAVQVAVHTLGGIGYTTESACQLYFRRVKGWGLVAGDPTSSLDEAARSLFQDRSTCA